MTKSNLESKSFSHLLNLKYLTIKFCKISKFYPDILYGLDNLKNFTLKTNNIIWADFNLNIEQNSFNYVKNLESLDLSQNNIWSLPQNIFCILSRLTFLNISENRLQDINELGFRDKLSNDETNNNNNNNNINQSSTVTTSTVTTSAGTADKTGVNITENKSINNKLITSTLKPLTSISITNNDKNKINKNNNNNKTNKTLTSSSAIATTTTTPICSLDLETLDLSYNNFVLLPAHGFGILKRLKILKLNNNEISMVAEKALNGLRNLRVLNLNSNKIVSLPSELFSDALNSIQEIYLQNNSITVLSPKLFFNLTQLQALDLSFNQITSTWIDKNTFLGLIRLVLLNLSHNRITKLQPDFFVDLYTLQILNLRHNQLEHIEANTFASMNNLHTLLLSYNKLKYLDAYALNGLFVLSLLSIDNNQISSVHQDSFRNCSSLQDINLNGNQIKIVPLALKNMRLLRTLDLGENLIGILEENAFEGLNNLYGLRLIQNSLQNISAKMFKDLPNLQILNLAHNHITQIEKGSFINTTSIQAIRLDGNHITEINDLFLQIPSLLWLNISDNKLHTFDLSQISNNLQWLDIHKNEIRQITNLQQKSNQLHLQTFDASFNLIENIAPDSIPNSIELLFLNDNLITSIDPDTFLEKPNLTRVDLYANQIQSLDTKSFRIKDVPYERALPEFYIGGNPFICDCNIEWLQKINSMGSRQYPKIMDLETIYCKLLNAREKAYISLVKAKSKHFLCPYLTHCFALCHCCDFDACDCEMTCPNNCTCFHDQSWSTNIVECSAANYTEIPSTIPMDTTEVYIDGNNLIELSGHSFLGRKNLQILYANNSNIQVIYNTTFSSLKKLTILHMEQNKLHRLYGHEFNHLENLRELFLQFNKINFIANGTFVRLAKLEVLRLDGNKLVQFEVWQLTLNPLLVQIGLAGNVWSCECSYLSRFRTFLQINSEKIIDANRVACIYNNMSSILKEKNGTKCTLREGISTYVRGSEIENLLPLLLVGTCAFVLFFGLILGLFCYRQELYVWAQKNCLFNMCFRNVDYIENYHHKDRMYDAYITYSHQDEHFVNQILADTLENDIGYRLCLHYRDLNLSLYITDIILEAVDSSKQALIVLSKNFLYNEWTRFEYKSALHEIVSKRYKIVFILYGDLPQRDLDADMRHYLRTNTCIEWDDKKFWQKLRLALPNPGNKTRPHTQSQTGGVIADNNTTGTAIGGTLNQHQKQFFKNRNTTNNIYGTTQHSLHHHHHQHHDYSTLDRNHHQNTNTKSSGGVYDNYGNFQRISGTGNTTCSRKYSTNYDSSCNNYNTLTNNQKNNLSINTIDKKHEYATIPTNCLSSQNSAGGGCNLNPSSNYGLNFDHQSQNFFDSATNGLDFLLKSKCSSTVAAANDNNKEFAMGMSSTLPSLAGTTDTGSSGGAGLTNLNRRNNNNIANNNIANNINNINNNDVDSNPTISNSALSICNLSLSQSISSSGSLNNSNLNNFNSNSCSGNTVNDVNGSSINGSNTKNYNNFLHCNNCNEILSDNSNICCNCNNQNIDTTSINLNGKNSNATTTTSTTTSTSVNNDINCKTNKIIQTLWS